VGEVVTGTTPAKSNIDYYGSDYRFYKPTDLNAGYYVSKSTDGLSKAGLSKARLLPTKSVLVTCIGATIGKTGLIRVEGASNQQINAIVPASPMCQEFLYFMCISPDFQRNILANSSSTTLPILNKSKFESLYLPVAPLEEQKRIVDKLEELLSDLDEAVKSLSRVQAQLKRYRQSVLKYAVEGKLTVEWREKHKGETEPADQLLKRILAERRAKWEEQELAKMKANGKVPKDDTWKKKYKEPAAPDTDGLPKLPEGWCWAALEQLAVHRSGIAYKSSDFVSSGVQVIKLGNLYSGRFDLSRDPSYLPENHPEILQGLVEAGDLLVSQTGTRFKRDYGHFVKVPSCRPVVINQRVLAVKVLLRDLIDWILYASQTEVYKNHFFLHETGGVNQGNVGIAGVMRGPIPLPPLMEIAKLVDLIEEACQQIDINADVIAKRLGQVDKLKASMLTKAFRGTLVSQEPNDEPASVLLERIRAHREEEANGKRKFRATPKKPRTRMTRRKIEQQEGQGELFEKQD
jgi:type I restriction enzyme S subunit